MNRKKIHFIPGTTGEHRMALIYAAIQQDDELLNELTQSSKSQLPEKFSFADSDLFSDFAKQLCGVEIILHSEESAIDELRKIKAELIIMKDEHRKRLSRFFSDEDTEPVCLCSPEPSSKECCGTPYQACRCTSLLSSQCSLKLLERLSALIPKQ